MIMRYTWCLSKRTRSDARDESQHSVPTGTEVGAIRRAYTYAKRINNKLEGHPSQADRRFTNLHRQRDLASAALSGRERTVGARARKRDTAG
jgi:hypothetical protein